MRRTDKHTTTIKPAGDGDRPDDPAETERLRERIVRRIAQAVGNQERAWRDCSQGSCRRSRSCQAPGGDCVNLPPRPPLTPEEEAWVRADIYRAVKARMAELEAEGKR